MNIFTPGETRSIWKYLLPNPGDTTTYEVPGPARIVHLAHRNGGACVWIEVWPGDKHVTTFTLSVVGTGWPYDHGIHLGTFVVGELVWHVLDVG